MKRDAIRTIQCERVIAILRGVDRRQCMPVAEALYTGGIRVLEIPYEQKDIETGKYRLTVRLFEIGSRAISGMNLVSISRPYLEQLAAGTGETVHLVARNNDEVVYLYKEDRRESVIHMASFVGLRSPMYRTAVGKSILALLPEEEVRRIWDRSVIEPLTPNTIVRYDDLLENLAIVRQRGWAMDNEENELGVLCIAAPIKDFTNTPIGAISISAPAARMTFSTCERFALKVIASTNAISKALGAPVTVSPV